MWVRRGGGGTTPQSATHIIHVCCCQRSGLIRQLHLWGDGMGLCGECAGELCTHSCCLSTTEHSTVEGQPFWLWTQHWPPKSASCKDNSLLRHVCHRTSLDSHLPTLPYARKDSNGGPYPSSCCAPSIPFLIPSRPQIIKVPVGTLTKGETVIEALTSGVE